MKRKLFEEVEGEENKVPTTSQEASEKPSQEPEVPDQKSNPSEDLKKLTDLMTKDYTSFVKELSNITSDNNLFPKLKNLEKIQFVIIHR